MPYATAPQSRPYLRCKTAVLATVPEVFSVGPASTRYTEMVWKKVEPSSRHCIQSVAHRCSMRMPSCLPLPACLLAPDGDSMERKLFCVDDLSSSISVFSCSSSYTFPSMCLHLSSQRPKKDCTASLIFGFFKPFAQRSKCCAVSFSFC